MTTKTTESKTMESKAMQSTESNDLLVAKDLVVTAKIQREGQPDEILTIVDGVSFTLQKGKVLGLIGEPLLSNDDASQKLLSKGFRC